jgi:hypothetical protein
MNRPTAHHTLSPIDLASALTSALDDPGPWILESNHPYVRGYIAGVDEYAGYTVTVPSGYTPDERREYENGKLDARGNMHARMW